VASFLFVVGIMMSRANVWVLAHWSVTDKDVAEALDGVVEAGVVQSGVGYSVLLAAFFVPARLRMDRQIGKQAPGKLRSGRAGQKWLDHRQLTGQWRDDFQQLLALRAPVLAAPVFDAIAK
jgi:hypothetical protein